MWKNIFGHKKQIEQLQRALKENRLPHALLFSGPEGVGKRLIAMELTQTLVGPSEKIGLGMHPDVHLIEPDGKTIKIEVLRNLRQKIRLHPLEGKAKVVIIDPAEAMTEAGANALLKILEEPPSETHFILISARPVQLLPTIRSRCQRIDFSPLAEKEVVQILKNAGVEETAALRKAAFAQGSIAVATAFETGFLKEIENDLENLAHQPSPSLIFNLAKKWEEEEEQLPQILTSLYFLWHKKITDAKNQGTLEGLERQWAAIRRTERGLETHANKQLLLENLLFTLAQ